MLNTKYKAAKRPTNDCQKEKIYINQLKEEGRTEERSIVLDALMKLDASPASLQKATSDAVNQSRLTQVSMQQSKASAA